jgi:hypothetical protein
LSKTEKSSCEIWKSGSISPIPGLFDWHGLWAPKLEADGQLLRPVALHAGALEKNVVNQAEGEDDCSDEA